MLLVMRSHLSPVNPNSFALRGSQRYPFSLLRVSSNPAFRRLRPRSYFGPEIPESRVWKHVFRRRIVQVRAMDEDYSSLDDQEDDDDILIYRHSTIEIEESDGDNLLNPMFDIDLLTAREPSLETNDGLNGTANRLAMIPRGRRKSRVEHGVITNIGLLTFLTILLLLVDCCAWRIVRLPLEPFYMTRPFCISAVAVWCAGFVCVPLLRSLKICSIIRREGPARHSSKKGTPTMGGLFFVPIGIIVAEASVGFSSIEVRGAAVATLAFAAIGLLDDALSIIKNHNYRLSALMKILLEVAVGSIFSIWLDTSKISSPYSMKMLVPLPAPLGLVCLGQCYLLLTSFCFVSMTNGINLTDGLDGLAGGTAALAFIGMSIAVLPICTDLSVFGASMAGACIGFLSHNRYKASVFMGDVGSLALGGALAAIASCTGMFLPLFISSGIIVLEAVSVIMQVSFFKTTKCLLGRGRRLFKMAPFHHHLELCGIKEPIIVGVAYVISSLLALLAGYVGLISA